MNAFGLLLAAMLAQAEELHERRRLDDGQAQSPAVDHRDELVNVAKIQYGALIEKENFRVTGRGQVFSYDIHFVELAKRLAHDDCRLPEHGNGQRNVRQVEQMPALFDVDGRFERQGFRANASGDGWR